MSKKEEERISKIIRFSLRRTFGVAARVINQIRRDRRTFALLTVVPTIIMLIFGLALGGDIQDVPVVLDNQDVGYMGMNAGQNVTKALLADTRIEITNGTYDENIENVENGKYFAIIHIPANFSETIFRLLVLGHDVEIKILLYLDATKPTIRVSILGALQDSLSAAMGEKGISVIQNLAHDGASFTGLDVGIPAVIGFVLIFLLLIISILTIVRERIQGTQDRLYATPLRSSERLLGYVVGLLLIASVMIACTLIIGVFVFGAKVQGNAFMLILAAFIFGVANVFMALFLSNFAQNELQAIQFAPLIAIPSMALSGMLVPIESLPNWLEPISYIVPLTYGINLFEGIMLKGWGFKELWLEFTVITGMAILFFILAVLTVRDRMKD